jgi:hypothetical protein
VAARLRLNVVLRIPVRVENDDGVGRRQVDADAAGARAEQKHERVVGRLGDREAVDRRLAVGALDVAVEALERKRRQRQ